MYVQKVTSIAGAAEQARRPTLLRKGFPAPLFSETNTTSGTGPIHSILSPISAAILNFKERILTADENGSGHAAEWSYRVTVSIASGLLLWTVPAHAMRSTGETFATNQRKDTPQEIAARRIVFFQYPGFSNSVDINTCK